jgi:hypothetical protein
VFLNKIQTKDINSKTTNLIQKNNYPDASFFFLIFLINFVANVFFFFASKKFKIKMHCNNDNTIGKKMITVLRWSDPNVLYIFRAVLQKYGVQALLQRCDIKAFFFNFIQVSLISL